MSSKKPLLKNVLWFFDKILNFTGYRSENNFVRTLKIMSNAAKHFNMLTTSLSILHNYFDSSTKLLS